MQSDVGCAVPDFRSTGFCGGQSTARRVHKSVSIHNTVTLRLIGQTVSREAMTDFSLASSL